MKIIATILLVVALFSGANSMRVANMEKEGIKEVGLVAMGILEGVFANKYQLQECIHDSQDIIHHLEAAYSALKKKGHHIKDIGEALTQVGEALKQLPDTVKECEDCLGIIGEIRGFATLFVSPGKFLVKSGLNILWHRKDISKDIKGAISDWENNEWENFGIRIGDLIKIAFKQKKAMEQAALGNPITDTALFFKGFLEEASGPIGDLTQCIESSHDIYSEVEELAHEFSSHMGISNIKNIATHIKTLIEMVPTEFKHCKAIPEETLHIFMTWGKEFTSVVHIAEKIAKALWKHHTDMITVTKDFVHQIKARDFEHAGRDLTDFIVIFLGKPNSVGNLESTVTDLFGFMEHYWLAAFNLKLDISSCEANGEKTVQMVKEVYTMYTNGQIT